MSDTYTVLSDVFARQKVIEGVTEALRLMPGRIWNSGACSQVLDPQVNALIRGSLVTNVPFWKDLSDGSDAIQVEGTAPEVEAVAQGEMVTRALLRAKSIGETSFAATLSTLGRPIDAAVAQLAPFWAKAFDKIALNTVLGYLATALAANVSDISGESGDASLFTPSSVFALLEKFGELQDSFAGGVMLVAPKIYTAMRELDDLETERASDGSLTIRTWKQIPVIQVGGGLLEIAGSPKKYRTLFLGNGVLATGRRTKSTNAMDLASLSFKQDEATATLALYDREMVMVHPDGAKWMGASLAGSSATNAELATAANWNLVYQSADRVAIGELISLG